MFRSILILIHFAIIGALINDTELISKPNYIKKIYPDSDVLSFFKDPNIFLEERNTWLFGQTSLCKEMYVRTGRLFG